MNGSVIIGSSNYNDNHLLCSMQYIIPLRVQRGALKHYFVKKQHIHCVSKPLFLLDPNIMGRPFGTFSNQEGTRYNLTFDKNKFNVSAQGKWGRISTIVNKRT